MKKSWILCSLLLIGIVLATISLSLMLLIQDWSARQMPTATPINCMEGYTEGMTPAQVSKLMNIPLVELTWLPEDLESIPQIRPHGLEWFDSSNGVTCVIRLSYAQVTKSTPEAFRNDLMIDILSRGNTRRTDIYPISCSLLDEALVTGRSIHCSGDLAGTEGRFAVSFFTHYSPDIAQKIADGIKLAE